VAVWSSEKTLIVIKTDLQNIIVNNHATISVAANEQFLSEKQLNKTVQVQAKKI